MYWFLYDKNLLRERVKVQLLNFMKFRQCFLLFDFEKKNVLKILYASLKMKPMFTSEL